MKALSVEELAMANLEETYRALCKSVSGSQIRRSGASTIATGPLPHAICNFALVNEVDTSLASELADLASDRPVFNLYSFNLSPESAHALSIEGFESKFALNQMIHLGCECQSRADLQKAESISEREAVASFMIHQFFTRMPASIRAELIQATAKASFCDLYSLQIAGDTVGAVMVSDLGDCLGLYNLVVHPSFQGRGLGTEIVNEVANIGFKSEKPVVLQCDPRLERWYERLGFSYINAVHVYNFCGAHLGR